MVLCAVELDLKPNFRLSTHECDLKLKHSSKSKQRKEMEGIELQVEGNVIPVELELRNRAPDNDWLSRLRVVCCETVEQIQKE